MKKLVVLTGAGMSAESGLRTFRDMNGLWEEYDVMEVASIEGWVKNKELILKFYNERRKQLKDAEPNAAHYGLVELEKDFEVSIITQNVDDLHERAGSRNILHLHGKLTEARSSVDETLIYEVGYKEVNLGDLCEKGSQLRPNIVWFGEMVPAIPNAAELSSNADIYVVIGSSLNVYPAAGLLNYVPKDVPVFILDPNPVDTHIGRDIIFIGEKAVNGISILKDKLSKLK